MNDKTLGLLLVFLLVISCSRNKTVSIMLNDHYSSIISNDACPCEVDEEIEGLGRYKPPIELLIAYEKFEANSNWKLPNNEADYKKVFFINSYENNMSLIAKEPIRLTHKNHALTLNLTPDIHRSNFYILPSFQFEIQERAYRGNYDNFDYSARAYLEYLTDHTSLEDFLEEILEEQFFDFLETDDPYQFKSFISEVNQKYKIALQESDIFDLENEDYGIRAFIKKLLENNIDILNFVLTEYVLTENTKHVINEEEKLRLGKLYRRYNDGFFEEIDFKLKNQFYDIYINGNSRNTRAGKRSKNRISVDINTAIVRKWDPITHKPALDSLEKDVTAEMLMSTYQLKVSNYQIDKIAADSLCTSTSEISGTGILLDFNSLEVIFPQKEIAYSPWRQPLNLKSYPFFEKDITLKKEATNNSDPSVFYDSTLTNFTGLKIPISNIQIPLNDNMLVVKGKDIIINNLFISGVFTIKCMFTEGPNDLLEINTNRSPLKISTHDLLEHLKDLGLNQVLLKKNDDSIDVFFKKEPNLIE